MTKMLNPSHPGLKLRDDVLPALPSRPKWPCVSRSGWVWRVVAKLGCGWRNKAPMTFGKQRSVSRPSPCAFSQRQRWLRDPAFDQDRELFAARS